MTDRITRIQRDALTPEVNAVLSGASVGSLVHLTFYGVASDAEVTELTDEWVEFREPIRPRTERWREIEPGVWQRTSPIDPESVARTVADRQARPSSPSPLAEEATA